MADALSDIVTFANAVGGMTDSFARLYDMKTRMRAERVEAEISRKEVEFLDRMRLPFGAEGRITTDNFRDELTKHETEIDSYVGRIDEEGVRARVSNSVQGGRSRFHETIMSQYYPKYVEEAQVEWSAGAKIDSDTFFKLPEGARTREVAGEYIKKIESGLASGLFDPAKAEEIRGKMSGYYYGIASADEKLTENGGDFDKSLLAASEIGNDEERKVALAEISRKQGLVEQGEELEFSKLLADDPIAAADFAQKKSKSGMAARANMEKRATDAIINSKITVPTNFASNALEHVPRWDATNVAAVNYLQQAKTKLGEWWDGLSPVVQNDKGMAEKYSQAMKTLDEKVSSYGEIKTKALDQLKIEYGNLEAAWLNKATWNGKQVEGWQLWSAALAVGAQDYDEGQRLRKRLLEGELYKQASEGDKALANAMSSDSAWNSLKNLVNSSFVIEGLSPGERKDIASALAKPGDKGNAKVIEKIKAMNQDVMRGLSVRLQDGVRRSADEIEAIIRELQIPYLANFEYVNEQPFQNWKSDIKGLSEFQKASDSGAFNGLYYTSKMEQSATPSALRGMLDARRSEAGLEFNRLVEGKAIPSGYKLNPDESDGDLWITGPNPNIKYGVDSGGENGGIEVYRYEKNQKGAWERKESVSAKVAAATKAATKTAEAVKFGAIPQAERDQKRENAAFNALDMALDRNIKSTVEMLRKQYSEEEVVAAAKRAGIDLGTYKRIK